MSPHDIPVHFVMGIPSKRSERWPLLIVVSGWLLLSMLTFTGVAGRSGMGWAVISLGIAIVTFDLFWTGSALPRKAAAASTIAFGVARSADYLMDDIKGPMAVWIIVSGLALVAYRSSVRQDRRAQ